MKEAIPLIIPILGISAGIIIPLAVFVLVMSGACERESCRYRDSKNLDDSSKVEKLLAIFDERKKQPIDYRRGGVITAFVGVGIFLLGLVALGPLLKGVGLLVCAIGIGTKIADIYIQTPVKNLRMQLQNLKINSFGENHKNLLNNLQEIRRSAVASLRKNCQRVRRFQGKALMQLKTVFMFLLNCSCIKKLQEPLTALSKIFFQLP